MLELTCISVVSVCWSTEEADEVRAGDPKALRDLSDGSTGRIAQASSRGTQKRAECVSKTALVHEVAVGAANTKLNVRLCQHIIARSRGSYDFDIHVPTPALAGV